MDAVANVTNYGGAGATASAQHIVTGTSGGANYAYVEGGEGTNTWQSATVWYTFDANRNLHSFTDQAGNTNYYEYTFDPQGKLASIDTSGTNTATYAYDTAGNRVGETTAGTTTYWLIDANNPTGYAYDRNGNRLTKTHDESGTSNDVTNTYAYDARDELTSQTVTQNGSTTTTTNTYDPAGNQKTSGTDTYAWDPHNHMTSATIGGVTTTYAYATSGARVAETTGGNTTAFLNDADNPTGYVKPLEETLNGTLSRSYVLGLRVEGQSTAADGPLSLLSDGHGSTRALFNISAAIVERDDYDAFGTMLLPKASKTEWLYGSGGIFDPASGTYIAGVRFYQTEDGRWTSSDSRGVLIGDMGNANLYVFVSSNAVNLYDPSGQSLLAEALVVAGVTAFLASMLLVRNIAHGFTQNSAFYVKSSDPSGPDITMELLSMRKDVKRQLAALTPTQFQSIRDQMYDRKVAQSNWDVKYLYDQGMTHEAVTVTIDGKARAYTADKVNYWLYGCALKELGIPRAFGELAILVHRRVGPIFADPLGSGIEERTAWFDAGYDGDLSEAQWASIPGKAPNTTLWEPANASLEYYVGNSGYGAQIRHTAGTPWK